MRQVKRRPGDEGASFLAKTLHLREARWQIRGVFRPDMATIGLDGRSGPNRALSVSLVDPSLDLAVVWQLGRKIPSFMKGYRSLIAGWAVKPSVQRLSGDECPCRVMVLSAIGVSRRMMVSEAPAS